MRKHRQHAVKQSRSVVMGQVSEQIAPLLPNFPYHYKDVMFLGKGVDYIVFDGLHTGYLEQIILLEVKSGNSQLNRNEKLIRDCIRRGAVEYDVWRI
jgi:predicted Holliday junction resolvase-like endonuclease